MASKAVTKSFICAKPAIQQQVLTPSPNQRRSAAVLSSNICKIPMPIEPTPHSQTAVTAHTGTCSVCGREDLHIVNSTDLLPHHGPRDNECKGSRSRPLLGSLKPVHQSQLQSLSIKPSANFSQLTLVAAMSDDVSLSSSGSTTHDSHDVIQHPARNSSLLKRILKHARIAASSLLLKLINDVLQHPESTACWSRLLGFALGCLSKPSRGGKSRNLTTAIIKQIQQYESGTEPSPAPTSHRSLQRRPVKTHDEQIAALASAKLEDGDVKGAVRLLCSDDGLAAVNENTLNALANLHPPAPADRRAAPTTDVPPLQVTPAAVRAAVQSCPNGSAAGPDGLRPQHIKDLLLGVADDHPLLVGITYLINLLLGGHTPTSVRGALFGATLLAIAKKTGGIRPIAVGYVWRRLAAKVACNYIKVASATLLAPNTTAWLRHNKRSRGCRPSSKALRRQYAAGPAVSENRLQERLQHSAQRLNP